VSAPAEGGRQSHTWGNNNVQVLLAVLVTLAFLQPLVVNTHAFTRAARPRGTWCVVNESAGE